MESIKLCKYNECNRTAWNYNYDKSEDEREHDLEHGENALCIFHSNEDNKEQEIKIEWVKYLQKHRDSNGDVNNLFCDGFVFPIPIVFQNTTFNGTTRIINSTFKCLSNFSGATFNGQCVLTGIHFYEKTDFSGAKFKKSCLFIRTIFNVSATFDNATFSGHANFKEAKFRTITKFNSSLFKDNALFAEIESNNITFDKSEFLGEAIFSSAKFSAKTKFNGVKFYKKASFDKSTFLDIFEFIESHFNEEVNFKLAVMKNGGSFKKTHFPKNRANFSGTKFWKECSFRGAIFFGTNLKYGSFANCTFANIKYNKKFKIKPSWKLGGWEIFSRTNFEAIETSGIHSSRNRLFVRDIEDQQFLDHYKEKHKYLYYIWLISCDCGRSFLQWFFVCAVFVYIFGRIYWCNRFEWFDEAQSWHYFTSYYYSVVTFSTLGFGDISPIVGEVWGEFWVMLEVILGYIGLGGLISIFANKLARRA